MRTVKLKNLNFRNAVSYIAAEGSLVVVGKLPDEQVQQRLAVCDACPHQIVDERGRWCGACGCGKWNPRAKLETKSTMPLARCPKNKW